LLTTPDPLILNKAYNWLL